MTQEPGARAPSRGAGTLGRVNDLGTGFLVLAGVAGAADPGRLGIVTAVVAGALFVVGTVALGWALLVGIARSRTDQVTLGGLFFLAEGAPSDVRRRFLVALVVQTVVGVAAASVRPYTAVAFAVLGPMCGVGLMAAWGARHGRFAARAA